MSIQTAADLQRRLEGEPNLEELAAEVANKDPTVPQTQETPIDDPKDHEVYTFTVDWTDARGKRWQGSFDSTIPTIQMQRQAGILQARLNDGLPKASLDPVTDEINYILAQSAYRITKFPDWWKPAELNDVNLLYAVYQHVMEHEQFFRRSSPGEAARSTTPAERGGAS